MMEQARRQPWRIKSIGLRQWARVLINGTGNYSLTQRRISYSPPPSLRMNQLTQQDTSNFGVAPVVSIALSPWR
jgi:hypothetical protein